MITRETLAELGPGVEATELRRSLSEKLNQVAYAKERVIITRHGKAVAALVPIEDAQLLEELEDRIDLEEAEAQGTIPFDQAVARAARATAFRGKFAHFQLSTDQFMRDKREELEREESQWTSRGPASLDTTTGNQ